jgi:hypothetical protein
VKAVNKKEPTIATADISGKGQDIMAVESAVATRRQTHFAFLPVVDRLPTLATNKPCVSLQMNPFSGHVIHFTSHVFTFPQKHGVSHTGQATTFVHLLRSQSEVFSG